MSSQNFKVKKGLEVNSSITASSDISASGNISASKFIGTFDGALSSSEQISSDISGSFTGYLTGSNIVSQSSQLGESISGSWLGYLTGSGIFSQSSQLTPESAAISGSWLGYLTGSGIFSQSSQLTPESAAISGSWLGYLTGSNIVSESSQLGSSISGSLGSNADLIRSLTAVGISGSWLGYLTGSNIVSQSSQLGSSISGSLGSNADLIRSLTATGISGSWLGYLTGSNIVSQSSQIASDISGSWLGYLTGSNIVSQSSQLGSSISGSLGTNADLIRSLTATGISGSWLGYLTGSNIVSQSSQFGASDNVTFGDITANSIHTVNVTASFITSSIIETSGSNVFGNDDSDTHTFVGSITASNISASGDINLSAGSKVTFVDTNTQITELSDDLFIDADSDVVLRPNADVKIQVGAEEWVRFDGSEKKLGIKTGTVDVPKELTVEGDISASGVVYTKQIESTGSANVVNINDNVNVIGNITASGDISSSGTIDADIFTINGFRAVDYNSTRGVTFGYGTQKVQIGRGLTQTPNITLEGNVTASGDISGSLTSTGSFGHLMVGGGDFSSASLASAIAGTSGGGGIFVQTGSFFATTNDIQITGSLFISASGGSDALIVSGGIKNIADGDYRVHTDGDILLIAGPHSSSATVGDVAIFNGEAHLEHGYARFYGISRSLALGPGVNESGGHATHDYNPRARLDISGSMILSGPGNITASGNISASDIYHNILYNQNGALFNQSGNNGVVRVGGADDVNLIVANNTGNNKVGIGTAEPTDKLTVSGSISASGDLSIDGNATIYGHIKAQSVISASKFVPKDATADIGTSAKRISTIYMASEIDYNDGSTDALKLNGGSTGVLKSVSFKSIFTNSDSLLANNTNQAFYNINPNRVATNTPIFRVAQNGRALFDVRSVGNTNYGSIAHQGGNSLPAYNTTKVDKYGQSEINATLRVLDYTFESPPSGGAWIDFISVSSGSGGVESGSAAVMGMWSGKPTLALGTNKPSASLHISSSISESFSDLIRVQNDIGVPIFKVKPDKLVLRNSGSSANETTMSVDSNNNLVINENLKINHRDVRFQSGSKEVIARVNPTSGQINFESDDGSRIGFKGAEREYKDSSGKIQTKVTIDGNEFIRSGSATANQIQMQQNANGAFITVSGSVPGYNIIRTGTVDKRLIRENYDLLVTNGNTNIWTTGITPNSATGDWYSISKNITHNAPGTAEFFVSGSGLVGVSASLEVGEDLIVDGNVSASSISSSGDIVLGDGASLVVDNGDIINWGNDNSFGLQVLRLGQNYGYIAVNGGTGWTPGLVVHNSGSNNAKNNARVAIGSTQTNTTSYPPKALTVEGDISASDDFYSPNFSTQAGNITASGIISASGTGHTFGGILQVETLNALDGDLSISSDINSDIIFKQSLSEIVRFSGTGHITASGNISASGTLISNEIDVRGHITSSGNISVSGTKFIEFGSIDYGIKVGQNSTQNQLVFQRRTDSSELLKVSTDGIQVTGVISGSGNLEIDGNATIDGALTATRKSFLIPHPTDESKQLQYASLEGPENGVYIRGKLKGNNIIELPHYWSELIDRDTITVSLTPIGRFQYLYVRDISSKEVMVGINQSSIRNIYCHYVVYAERKDIDKLEVEITNG